MSTFPIGPFRVRHDHEGRPRWILPTNFALDNPLVERVTFAAQKIANRALLDRARSLPPVVPTLAMLPAFLRSINAHALPPTEDRWSVINHWCRIVEVCDTDEARKAFSYAVLPDLYRLYDEFLAGVR